MTGPLAYLSRLCRRWGGELVLLAGADFRAMHRDGCTTHPDGAHRIRLATRSIFADVDRVNPGTVCHEMGHVFLEQGNPTGAFEPDWFGWEAALARRARCYRTWSKQNDDYVIVTETLDGEWGEFTRAEQRTILADRIAYAITIGIVSRRGEPLCTRKP